MSVAPTLLRYDRATVTDNENLPPVVANTGRPKTVHNANRPTTRAVRLSAQRNGFVSGTKVVSGFRLPLPIRGGLTFRLTDPNRSLKRKGRNETLVSLQPLRLLFRALFVGTFLPNHKRSLLEHCFQTVNQMYPFSTTCIWVRQERYEWSSLFPTSNLQSL